MLEALSKKQKIIFLIILAIMIAIIIYYIYSTLYNNDFKYSYDNNILIENDLLENPENENFLILDDTLIIVYVCGAVKESRVVSLKKNSRICDAIDAVGGLTEEADLTNINLAYILEDGEKIYIPKKGEELPSDTFSSSSQNSSYSNYSSNTLKNNKININKASQTELEAIPGIGPSTALKIINYREENGKFSKIEDIKNVSGIGDSKYEQVKEYITVR